MYRRTTTELAIPRASQSRRVLPAITSGAGRAGLAVGPWHRFAEVRRSQDWLRKSQTERYWRPRCPAYEFPDFDNYLLITFFCLRCFRILALPTTVSDSSMDT